MEEQDPVTLTPSELATIRDQSVHHADYNILSRHIRLSGNSPAIIERFDALYAAFRRTFPTDHAPDTHLRYHVSDDRVFIVESEFASYRTTYPELVKWPSVLFNRIIIERIHTHYLIHAGCVARDGKAIVIAGASGMGKTTLVAHLAARGFEFLSDEFAPICRGDGMVEPYPLRLGLREGPGRDLLGDKDSIHLTFRRDDKKLADIETLAGRKPARRSALRAVIFFTTDLTASVTTAQKRGDRLRAWFMNWSDAMAEDISKTLGSTVEDRVDEDDMTGVTLKLRDLVAAVPALRDLARRHDGLLAQIQFEDLGELNRTVSPQLMPIPAAAGVIELIKKIPNSSKVAIIENVFAGKASAMVMDVSAVIRKAEFYKLTPGRLDETIALVERLAT